MANISREEDERDFEERKKNNWNRPHVCQDKRETTEERIKRLDAEVKANMEILRALAPKRKRGA